MAARVTGVRHIKIWVTDLQQSRAWFERVFGLELALTFEDEDGVVRGMTFRVPGADFELALRENPARAAALDDADPFALATTRDSLDDWVAHLDALGIWHSPIVTASRGYALGFRDPDGMQIRLYADDAEITAQRGDRVVSRSAPTEWDDRRRS
jgi:catechol 2,3-dioxygenase-like lactoylglutathione lyase family enzyme